MEAGHDIKAALSIFMQTTDLTSFTYTLKNTKVSLNSLSECNGSNIFHDIAECSVKESYLLNFLEILISEFQDRYFEDSSETIKAMLNSQSGREQQTPMMQAVRNNRSVINNQKLLIEFVKLGGNFGLKNNMDQTLVHIAASNGFDRILVYLHTVLGLSIHEVDFQRRTPLHLAALEGHVSVGMLLIVWSEDLDLKDSEGFTALHLAAYSQCYKLVRNLVIRNADQNIKDIKGDTPLDIALIRGDPHILKLLVKSN